MKILLDECIDRRFAHELAPLSVKTVPQMGCAGIKNGELLALAEKEFAVFLTVDRNLSFQQPVSKFEIAVLVLKSKSNRLADLMHFGPKVLSAVANLPHGTVTILAE